MSIQKSYHPASKVFHWLVAALLFCQIPLGLYMVDLPLSPDKLEAYALHKSVGLTIWAVMALRLGWRLIQGRPAMPEDASRLVRIVAKTAHVLMYLLLLLMPLSGWFLSSAANMAPSWFGVFQLPLIIEPDPDRTESFHEMHEIQAFILMTLIGMHVIAAVYHHLVRRDGVLRSMLPRFSRDAGAA